MPTYAAEIPSSFDETGALKGLMKRYEFPAGPRGYIAWCDHNAKVWMELAETRRSKLRKDADALLAERTELLREIGEDPGKVPQVPGPEPEELNEDTPEDLHQRKVDGQQSW